MENNGVNNNTNTNTAQPVLIPIEDNAVQQPVAPAQPAAQSVISQVQVVQPATTVAAQPAPVVTQETPTTQPPQVTPAVVQPQQPAVPTTTKDGIPLNHPQMIINGADQSVLEEGKELIEKMNNNGQEATNETSTEPPKVEVTVPKEKKPVKVNLLLVLVIFILVGLLIYSSKTHNEQINNLAYNCTAVASSKEEKELDLNSTLVKDLYNKVKTSIREDYAQPEFNNTMKLYLAYRQVKENEKYDSNCNLFNSQKMEPYKCEVSLSFVPKAFKEETLEIEYKKLFGENTEIALGNIKLENDCIGGYQYIPERKEFVQGKCDKNNSVPFKVDKKLKKAVSTKNMIVLTEEVKYRENEKLSLPEYLKSGTYYYTFRLDINYNWVLISKTYYEKY